MRALDRLNSSIEIKSFSQTVLITSKAELSIKLFLIKPNFYRALCVLFCERVRNVKRVRLNKGGGRTTHSSCIFVPLEKPRNKKVAYFPDDVSVILFLFFYILTL